MNLGLQILHYTCFIREYCCLEVAMDLGVHAFPDGLINWLGVSEKATPFCNYYPGRMGKE